MGKEEAIVNLERMVEGRNREERGGCQGLRRGERRKKGEGKNATSLRYEEI